MSEHKYPEQFSDMPADERPAALENVESCTTAELEARWERIRERGRMAWMELRAMIESDDFWSKGSG